MVVEISEFSVKLDQVSINSSASSATSFNSGGYEGLSSDQKYFTNLRNSIKNSNSTVTGLASDKYISEVNYFALVATNLSNQTTTNTDNPGNFAIVTEDIDVALNAPYVAALVTHSRAEKMRAESLGKVVYEVGPADTREEFKMAAFNVRKSRYYSPYYIGNNLSSGNHSYIDRSSDGYDGLVRKMMDGEISQFIHIPDGEVYLDAFTGSGFGTLTAYSYKNNSNGSRVAAQLYIGGSLQRPKTPMDTHSRTNDVLAITMQGTSIEPLGIEVRPFRHLSGTPHRYIYTVGTTNYTVGGFPYYLTGFTNIKSSNKTYVSGDHYILGNNRTFMINCGMAMRRADYLSYALQKGSGEVIDPYYSVRSINQETGTHISSSMDMGSWIFIGDNTDRVRVTFGFADAWTSLTPVQIRGDISFFSAFEI